VEVAVNSVWAEECQLAQLGERGPQVLHPCLAAAETAILRIDVIQANAGNGFNLLVGSAHLPLREVLDERLGTAAARRRDLHLKQPSGRRYGHIDVRITGWRRVPAIGIRA
jgi:hypothetical protein